MPSAQQIADLQTLQLEQGVSQLGVSLSGQQSAALVSYLQLLDKWNKAFNLTAIRDPAQYVSRHLLDSLALLPLLADSEATDGASPAATASKCPQFLDVGTGAGLPGLPLAIAMPDTHWYLLDSNGKKTRFLSQCKMALSLTNVEVIHCRVEDFQLPAGSQLSGITSRAFATLKNFVDAVDFLISGDLQRSPSTRLYAMKGEFPKNEVSELPNNYKIQQTVKLNVPGCEGARHLLILTRHNS